MTNNLLQKLTGVATLALSLSVIDAQGIRAATITYQFQGQTDSTSPLPNQGYSGSFSFDDSLLTSSYSGDLSASSVQMNFLGTSFTQADAADTPLVSFLNGKLLGLNFSVTDSIVNSTNISFSLIPGSSDTTDGFFSYDANQLSGAGDVIYTRLDNGGGADTSIPEPSSILCLLGLGVYGVGLGLKKSAIYLKR